MVSYQFYTNTYHGGAISEHDWPFYEGKAADQIKRYKRIYTVTVPKDFPEGESMAICAIAEALQGFDLIANCEGGAVQSASIGSVSTSFGSAGASAVDVSPKGQAKELYRLASKYLDIYRGVG